MEGARIPIGAVQQQAHRGIFRFGRSHGTDLIGLMAEIRPMPQSLGVLVRDPGSPSRPARCRDQMPAA
jgi:hypothetical protein